MLNKSIFLTVDIGLSGFFWNKPDFSYKEWLKFCKETKYEKIVHLNEKMRFYSNSGDGDGIYAIYENDTAVAIKIKFFS